jgi:phosphatidylglycerophosphate synthase
MSQQPYQSGERRPIATRDRKSSQWIAQWLVQRRVSPNAISIAGMICGLAAGLGFGMTSFAPEYQRWAWLIGAGLVQLRLLANMLDGMVAIAAQRASPVGELYNEIPDRVSDAAIFIGLGYAAGGMAVLGYAAAWAAIFTAYVRAVGKVAGAPQEFCGPMAKPHRMLLATLLGVYNGLAPAAWQPGHARESWGTAAIVLVIIIVGSLITAFRRLLRAAAALKNDQP